MPTLATAWEAVYAALEQVEAATREEYHQARLALDWKPPPPGALERYDAALEGFIRCSQLRRAAKPLERKPDGE